MTSLSNRAPSESFKELLKLASDSLSAAPQRIQDGLGNDTPISISTNSVNLNLNKLSGVLDPTLPQDAATKNYIDTNFASLTYVDSLAESLDPKRNVDVATTANIILAGLQTIDGIALSTGDRILVKNQTLSSENGIYIADSGAWTRSTDFDGTPSDEVTPGTYIFVEQGTTNINTKWLLMATDPIILGATPLEFIKVSDLATKIYVDDKIQSSRIIYRYIATSGQTTFSGADSTALILSYTPGAVDVFLNGAKLDRIADFTATTGTSVILSSPTTLNDILEVVSWTTVLAVANVGGSATQIQYNNTGIFAGDSGFTTNGAGSVNISGDLDVDNININLNTISSTNTNGNIILDPNGTGIVNMLGNTQVSGAQLWVSAQTLVDSATVAWDLNGGNVAILTLTGNRTMAAPTNLKSGGKYVLIIKQDATGSRTLNFSNSVFKFPGGVEPTLSTAGNAIDIVSFISDGTNLLGSFQGNFS